MPSHCSAPQASNRTTSVNPSFAARRMEPTLAVWVVSATGSPGRTPSNQSSAAAHASAAYPKSPRLRKEQVAEVGLPRGSRATVFRCPPEQDLADHRSVEINDEAPGPTLRHRGHLLLQLVTRRTSGEASSSMNAARSRASGSRSTSRSVLIGAGGQSTGPSSVTGATYRGSLALPADQGDVPRRRGVQAPRVPRFRTRFIDLGARFARPHRPSLHHHFAAQRQPLSPAAQVRSTTSSSTSRAARLRR